MDVPRVAAAEQAVKRHFKVILNDGAVELFRNAFPHRRETVYFRVQLFVYLLRGVGHLGPVRHVAIRGVDEHNVRLEA